MADRSLDDLNQAFTQLENRLDNLTRLKWLSLGDSPSGEYGQLLLPGQIISGVEAGTAPIVVASDTVITNLNASYLEGYSASDFSFVGHSHAESEITFTDILTGNASVSMHGYLPKLGSGSALFLREDGTWATPPAAGGSMPLQPTTDIVINDLGGDYNLRWESAGNQYMINMDAGYSVVSFGAAPVISSATVGVVQITSTGVVPALSLTSDNAQMGLNVYNSLAESTTSGGNINLMVPWIPSSAGKRIGRLAYAALETVSGYSASATLEAFTTEAWDGTHNGTYLSINAITTGADARTEIARFYGNYVSIGGVAGVTPDVSHGVLQVTAPATTPSISGYAISAGYGITSYNSLAESTTSGGVFIARASFTPSAADKRIGTFTTGAITTGTTYQVPARISIFSAEAFDSTHAGGYIGFYATPTGGSVTPSEITRMYSNYVSIGGVAGSTPGSEDGVLQVTSTGSVQGISINTNAGGHGLWIKNTYTTSKPAAGGAIGLEGVYTPSAAEERLGNIGYRAITTGSTSAEGASIRALSAEAWDSTHAGGYISMRATPIGGATSPIEIARMYSNYVSIGGVAGSTPGSSYGVLQVTAPASVHAASFHTITAGYGILANNTVAEGTTSGGVALLCGGFTPSATGKRIGYLGAGAITTGSTYVDSAAIEFWSSQAWGAAAAGSYMTFGLAAAGAVVRSEVLRLGADKSALFTGTVKSNAGGIGYDTGAGGTVTQLTSRTTGVTLNKLCGNITMFSAAQAAGALVTFTLTNSFIAATDLVIVQHISATNGGSWNFSVVAGAGSCTINVKNVSTGSITSATPLRFTIIKGVTA